MLKKVIVLLFCFSVLSNTYAGHEVGGIIIRYESVAQVNNNPNQYVLYMYSIYDKQGLAAPSTATINLTSGCFSNTSFSLPRISAGGSALLPLAGADYCSSASTIQNGYGLALYRDTIILPGVCSSYLFSIAAGFGRFNAGINMSNNFNTNYFEVRLNNMAGPNSSPVLPVSQFIQAVCTNKPISLFSYTDADGDSIHFTKSTPLYKTGNTTNPILYANGYSQGNQTGSTSGYVINNNTGEVQTTVNVGGTYILTCQYSEFRLDTNTNLKMLIGQSRISTVVQASSSCTPLPFNLSYPTGANPDSLSCTSSKIKVAASRKIGRGSLTNSASEFEVISVKQGVITVQSATFLNDSTIELSVGQVFGLNDTIQVTVTNGSDNNTLLSTCGQLMADQADTLFYFMPALSTVQAGFTQVNNKLRVNFNAQATSVNAVTYNWNFGDGSAPSAVANPVHTYAMAGNYNVQLVVENACGVLDTLIQNINVCDTLKGNFTYTLVSDSVVFDASSSLGGATQFVWDFGDGTTGTGAITKHKYAAGGMYWVNVLLVNICGDSLTYADSVEVCPSPWVDWNYTLVSTSAAGMTIDFDGSNATNTSTFLWNFGDGNTNSASLTPRHIYATPSLNYLVSLTVFNDCSGSYERAFKLNQIGLSEANALAVNLFPNPSTGLVQIEVQEEVQLKVHNTLGTLVFEKTLQASQTINLKSLANGVYYFSLKGAKGSKVIKHVVR